jgi:hypothetical protein
MTNESRKDAKTDFEQKVTKVAKEEGFFTKEPRDHENIPNKEKASLSNFKPLRLRVFA